MPRPKSVPSYGLHKPSGQARVILDGRQVYLGVYGSPESRERYARILSERFRSDPLGAGAHTTTAAISAATIDTNLSVNELCLFYLKFAETYYVSDGQPTGELHNVKDALRSLRTLYGTTRAAEVGPRALKQVRQHMIEIQDLSGGVVNSRIDRLKRMFKGAVREEMVPSSIYEALRTVSGLRFGRSSARETEPIRPVRDEWVQATLPFLPPQVADMVRLQRITGMRSANLVMLRPCDLDRSATVWIYEPPHHKTRHHNKRLFILIGPQGRAILQPYLTNRAPSAYCFCPAEVAKWQLEQRELNRKERKTPVYPCERRRVARAKFLSRRRKRARAPGEHYTSASYRRAIEYAIQKARRAGVEITSWHHHQLLHTIATLVRTRIGGESAQMAIGHAKANIT